MQINKNINIVDNKLSNGLQEVFSIIDEIEKSVDVEDTIDFSNTPVVSPTFVLPLMVFTKGHRKKIHFSNISPYMKLLHFGDGLSPDEMRKTEFIAHMEGYAGKTFIPVINFPATDCKADEKNSILSTVENIITKQVKLASNVSMGLKYMISEIVDNITEHAHSGRGYIIAQSYPKKGCLDICIADNGITLLGSYQSQDDNEIMSDLEAIQAANRGISTKNLPNAENRGYGITTSREMLITGLGGQYIMISGSAMYIRNKEIDKFAVLPNGIHWHGTIVAFRIPYINQDFWYSEYVK